MSRPFLKLDEKLIKELAGLGCTVDDIARVCDCSNDTLQRHYMHCLEVGRADAKVSIRRKQFQVAMDDEHKSQGTMLIWLGKVIAEQWETNAFLSKLPLDALLLEIDRRQRAVIEAPKQAVTMIDLKDRVKVIKGAK